MLGKRKLATRAKLHVKKGDKVVVITGRWRSKETHEVLQVDAERGRVTVQGVNLGTATVTASNPNFSSATSQVSSTGSLNIVQSSAVFRPAFPTSITVRLSVLPRLSTPHARSTPLLLRPRTRYQAPRNSTGPSSGF